MRCLCHSGKEYENCCRPYHDGEPAPTALALMRSRYSAYAMRKANYIMETGMPESQESVREWKRGIERFSDKTLFEGLEIVEDLPGEEESYVIFHARLRQGKQDVSFTEKSHFIKKEGRWIYTGPAALN